MPRLRFRANSVWLNVLNAPTRNSVFTRSVIALFWPGRDGDSCVPAPGRNCTGHHSLTLRAQSEQELLEACRSRSTGSRFRVRPSGAHVSRSWPAANTGQCGVAAVAFLATLAYCFRQLAEPRMSPLRTNPTLSAILFAARHKPKSASFTAGEEARYQASRF
jgi:hypothetical protein